MGEQRLRTTPLHALHGELGARLVPFAGYEMPVQYPSGIIAEHKHTRGAAGLFDVSHMGQVELRGDDPATALEALLPADVLGLEAGRVRYGFFTNERGGILDDLMIGNEGGHLALVVNAARKAADLAHLRSALPASVEVRPREDLALLALQGPAAAAVLARFDPAAADMPFMSAAHLDLGVATCRVTRSGYTGEDGYEISVPAGEAETLARKLLGESEVAPIGLGARDSLRLEAGLCLHGHDIDQETTPVEAGLAWAIGKRRRGDGGFPGDAVVRRQLAEGAPRKRVGLRPQGRTPVREGCALRLRGEAVGQVTSGGFGPTIGAPVAMGYVARARAEAGTALEAIVRGKPMACAVAEMPFAPHRYFRG